MTLTVEVTKKSADRRRKSSLVLLIHGLGAAHTTWINANRNWVKLLLDDQELDDVDIGIATYKTAHLAAGWLLNLGVKKIKLGRFRTFSVDKAPFTDIVMLSRELKRELTFNDIAAYENVIIVGHSMGGLVGIRYILEELEHGNSINIRGFISLATPFNGSSIAFFNTLVKSINPQAQILGLAPNSTFLDDTVRLLQKHETEIQFPCLFCYGIEDTLVPIESAIPHTRISKWSDGTPLPGDHSSILDVESHNSTAYRVVKEFIRNCVVTSNHKAETRAKALEDERTLSKSRCLVRLRAAGLSIQKADEVLKNTLFSNGELEPTESEPVSLLIGDFGVGKSMLADLMYQRAIDRALADDSIPVPVYLKASAACADLRNYLESILKARNDMTTEGLFIVIDGMDEVGVSLASQILDESRFITSIWHGCRIVLMSRPLSVFSRVQEARRIPELSEADTSNLISLVCERPFHINQMYHWPPSVKDAVRRPLFALLLGGYLVDQDMRMPRSTGELLSHLVERCFERSDQIAGHFRDLLLHLAVVSTDRGNTPIHKSEIASTDDLKLMNASGLTIQNGDLISFSLPILSEWFAAQSLKDGIKHIGEIMQDPASLEYWTYALVIFIGRYSYDDTEQIFNEIVLKNPALASIIVEQAIANWGFVSNVSPPPPVEAGRQLLSTMKIWTRSLGPISNSIAPIGDNSEIRPIGVGLTSDGLFTSWYRGKDPVDEITVLTGTSHDEVAKIGWNNRRWARPGRQSTWAWRWSRDELSQHLSQLLQNRELPPEFGHIAHEEIWGFSKAVLSQYSFSQKEIELKILIEVLSKFARDTTLIHQGKKFNLRRINEIFENMVQEGMSSVAAPWPDPDALYPNTAVWGGYSSDLLLERTQIVFAKAIDAYRQIVDDFFPCFKNRMNLYSLFPVTLKGKLRLIANPTNFGDMPTLDWYFDPSDVGSRTLVEIEITTAQGSQTADDSLEAMKLMYDKVRSIRPQAAHWITFSYHSQILDIFHEYPIRELAYGWIWDDLKKISWVTGQVGSKR